MTIPLDDLFGDLDQQPDPLGNTFEWADLVELRCLIHPNRRMSFSDIVKLADADADQSEEAMELLGNRADTELTGPIENGSAGWSHDGEYLEDQTNDRRARSRRSLRMRKNLRMTRPIDAASSSDRRDLVAADVVRVMEWRSDAFGEDYPFELKLDGAMTTITRRDQMSERHYLYLFLLICSSLSRLGKKQEKNFTYPFERLTAVVLRRMFPTAAVKIFGTSNSQDNDVPIKLEDKINYLARLLNGEIGRDVPLLSTSDQGDNGLDVFAHLNVGDAEPGRFIVFAQAACTDNWPTKQDSASAPKWQNTLRFQVPQFSICAIPISFRRSGGEWHNTMKLSTTLLLDRSRLMYLIPEGFADLEGDIVVAEATRERLDAILSASLTSI